MSSKLAAMRAGGAKLRAVREAVAALIKPGVVLSELEAVADRLIREAKGEAAFKRVPGYQWATCINVNEGVVHGIPGAYKIQDGDVVSLDVGMIYQGWYTDTSTTVIVGQGNAQKRKLLAVGQEAMAAAIKQARVGRRIGHISQAMERRLRAGGMGPVSTLTGHGVGQKLHEWPPIPCFLTGRVKDTPIISEGMSLAIEAIYTAGGPETKTGPDGWTIVTADGSLAGLFEHTVFIGTDGPIILT